MKRIFKRILVVILIYNLALFIATFVLTVQAEAKHPMQGKRVSAGKHFLHVIEAGTKKSPNDPTLVLLHGASTSAMDFSTQLQPRLAQRWRVLAFDRPGHGYSDRGSEELATDPAYQANMILDALQAMDVQNPIFIGHSWAGSVVMAALMAKHPQINVAAGVLISGATHPWDGDGAWHVELSAKPIIGDIFVWQYVSPIGRLSLQDAIDGVFSPEAVPDNYVDDTALNLSLRPATYKHNALDLTALSAHLHVQSKLYSRITQPLLSLASSEDHVVGPWNHHERIITQVKDAQGIVIQGAGHAPHHTQPEVVINAIETFVQSL